MTFPDPFADVPAPAPAPVPEPTPAPAHAPEPAPAAPDASVWDAKPATQALSVAHSTDGVSATFKFGGAYSDPWVVVKGADAGEVNAKLHDPQFRELMDFVKRVADVYGPSNQPAQTQAQGGGQRQSRAPQAAQEAPNGEKQYCQHGEMEYKTGVSKKTGKPYALFSCTAPRDQQCDAKWPSK
ncbi:hypothetical protein SEA_PAINTERBOY_51 [Mycobacterium phage PainterBoy]|nr:hypothetical protein SEA_PAINTERBOY_51 [Mycobacterium phage PainterBoy]